MIVAAAKNPANQNIIIVGLTEADIKLMRTGLTKTKEGNPEYGFSSMIVFIGESDQAMLEVLQQQGTVRRDDLFPNTGQG